MANTSAKNSAKESLTQRNIPTNEKGVIGSRPALQSMDNISPIHEVLSVAGQGWEARRVVVAGMVVRSGMVQKRFDLAFALRTLPNGMIVTPKRTGVSGESLSKFLHIHKSVNLPL